MEKRTPLTVVVLEEEVALAEADEIVPEAVPELDAEAVIVPLVRPDEEEGTPVDEDPEEEISVDEA